MSEEEKKAIEYLENQDNSLNWNYGTLQAIKTVLNIIEKYENYEYNKALIQQNNDLKIRIGEQQKEIEDLSKNQRYIKNLSGEKVFCLEYDKDTLKDMLIEKQEMLENSISKDKIKAKIKDVSNGVYDAKLILEDLLEEN